MGTSSIGYGFQTTFGSPFQLFSDFTKSCLKITPYTTGTQCLKLFKFISQWISGFRSNGSIVRALRNRQTDRWMDVTILSRAREVGSPVKPAAVAPTRHGP